MADEASNELRNLVNKSGYPLQIAIAHHVNAATSRHGWQVLYEEHGWRDAECALCGGAALPSIARAQR